jgi:hypothetical protein
LHHQSMLNSFNYANKPGASPPPQASAKDARDSGLETFIAKELGNVNSGAFTRAQVNTKVKHWKASFESEITIFQLNESEIASVDCLLENYLCKPRLRWVDMGLTLVGELPVVKLTFNGRYSTFPHDRVNRNPPSLTRAYKIFHSSSGETQYFPYRRELLSRARRAT